MAEIPTCAGTACEMSTWMHIRDNPSCREDVHRTLQSRNFGRGRNEGEGVRVAATSGRTKKASAATYLAPMPV